MKEDKPILKRKELQILGFLKREKRKLAESMIARYVGLPILYARKYLNNLESLKKVKKFEETNATYWEIVGVKE